MTLELTPEELLLTKQQTDPDISPQQITFVWDKDYQRSILSMLLNDINFTIQSQGLIKYNYFEHDAHKLAAKIVFNHFDNYRTLPTKIILFQEFEDAIREKPLNIKVNFRGELNTVIDFYRPGIDNREYLLDKITDFAKQQATQAAFFKCLEEFKKRDNPDKWSKINTILNDALKIDRRFDMGLDYFQSFEERYERMKKAKETGDVFTSGFFSIDNALSGGGLMRGEIGGWMGTSGSGKSLCLTKATLANVHRDKRVLYLSLELEQDRCGERFDSQLGNTNIKTLCENEEIVFSALREYVKEKADPRLLIVKHFPGKTMDMAMMRAYFAQIVMRGFRPDLVIVDYIGEMKDFPGMPTWESRQRIVGELRGFASEERFACLVAMQPDKRAKEVIRLGGLLDDENLADSYGQVRPLDALWSINQMRIEKSAGIARVYVSKHRFGEDKFEVYVEIDKLTLEIREITKETYMKRYADQRLKEDLTVQEAAARYVVGGGGKKKKKSNDPETENDPMEMP